VEKVGLVIGLVFWQGMGWHGRAEGILRGVFQNFNPLCRRNPIKTDLD